MMDDLHGRKEHPETESQQETSSMVYNVHWSTFMIILMYYLIKNAYFFLYIVTFKINFSFLNLSCKMCGYLYLTLHKSTFKNN